MPAASPSLRPVGRAMQVLTWEDVLVVVDDGRSRPGDYNELLNVGQAQRTKYRAGFGVLLVVPRSATPPPDDVRTAINSALAVVKQDLRCLCWLIEGAGFHAAMVRAVLTGVRVFNSAPYPMHVETTMESALAWMLHYLPDGASRSQSITEAVSYIQHARVLTDSKFPESGITKKL